MKKLVLIFVMTFVGAFAHAETDMQSNDAYDSDMQTQGLIGAWVCGMKFRGTSGGVKVIVGKFSTVAYGTLRCVGLGKIYTQKVKVTIGHHFISPTVGAGYFKVYGKAAEVSLLNASPDKLLGKYLVAQGEAAVIVGAGAFTAVKVGLPQLAVEVSLQFLKGFGAQVGIDGMKVQAVSRPHVVPQPTSMM